MSTETETPAETPAPASAPTETPAPASSRWRMTRDTTGRPLGVQIWAALNARAARRSYIAMAIMTAWGAGVICARLQAGIPL